MSIELFDPVGEIEEIKAKPQRILDDCAGKQDPDAVGVFTHPINAKR